jgi:hypothetical protein
MYTPKIQLKLALTLLVTQAVLSGCANQYLLKLDNGGQILSYSKPKKQGDGYLYTSDTGAKLMIPQNRVVRIKSVTVVKEEPKAPPTPKKPKHWYFLWLA